MPSPPPADAAPRLLDRVREVIRIKHYSIRTEQAYLHWIRRYILFHNKRHPQELGAAEFSAFLGDLAIQGKVSASTQNQALNAISVLVQRGFEDCTPLAGGRSARQKAKALACHPINGADAVKRRRLCLASPHRSAHCYR